MPDSCEGTCMAAAPRGAHYTGLYTGAGGLGGLVGYTCIIWAAGKTFLASQAKFLLCRGQNCFVASFLVFIKFHEMNVFQSCSTYQSGIAIYCNILAGQVCWGQCTWTDPCMDNYCPCLWTIVLILSISQKLSIDCP